MTNRRLLKRDTRRAIDGIIDYFGDSASTPAPCRTFSERLFEFLFEGGCHSALVPVPVARAAGMRRPVPSSRVRRFA
jgi:hypothetical protein